MALYDANQFSRGIITVLTLTNSARTVSTTPIRIRGVLVNNVAAAAEEISFRQVDDSPVYFTMSTPAEINFQYVPLMIELPDLEVILTSAGDVDLAFFIEEPRQRQKVDELAFSHTVIA